MLLNLSSLLRPGADAAEGDFEADLSLRDFYGYTVPAPVAVAYAVRLGNGSLHLKVSFKAGLEADCARCLAPAVLPLETANEYWITARDVRNACPDLPIGPDGSLDMDELVYGEIVMEAPAAILCRAGCLGLCPRCGRPAGGCGCESVSESGPWVTGALAEFRR